MKISTPNDFASEVFSIAAEPQWVEVSRAKLVEYQRELSSLIGRDRSKRNVGGVLLMDSELAAVEGCWEMLKDLLS